MTLSIIIVSFNGRNHLEGCLLSVMRAINGINAEVIVVDNQSTDGAPEMVKEKFPGVHLIQNPTNLGFAKACNIGSRASTGQMLLFLNPDCLLQETTLQSTVDYLDNHPKAGALGVQMIDGAGNFLPESKRGYPGAWNSFFKLSGLSSFFPSSKRLNGYYQPQVDKDSIAAVPVLSGAFFLVKRNVFEQVKGFDERYFMYAEDIDLSFSINRIGYSTIYYGAHTILHFKGISTDKDKLYISRFYDAMRLFVRKYNGAISSIPLLTGIWIKERIELLSLKKISDQKISFQPLRFEDYQSFSSLIEHIKNNPGINYNIILPESNNIIG